MIRYSFLTFAAVALVLSACANVGDAPDAETTPVEQIDSVDETTFSGTALPLNAENSSVDWTAAKITRTHDGGFTALSGWLYLDGETISGVELTVYAASIFSDTDRLTSHLKSADFFDVENFPAARFEATSFEPIAENGGESTATHTVTGTLTMRDQTNQIVFPAMVEIGAASVTASADFRIDRQLWGLSYPGQPDDLIQDDVRIKLNVSAGRTAETVPEEVEMAN